METIILFVLFFAGTLGGNCCSKLSSNRLEKGGYAVFFLINSGIACLFFLISGGFSLQAEWITAGFSLLYSCVVLLVLYSNMKLLQRMPIAYASIISSAANLLLTSLLGGWLFEEPFGWQTAVRIGLMLAASALIFAERKGVVRPTKGFLFPLTTYVAGCVSNYLVLKLYTCVPHRASDSSFFFFTNLIMMIVAVGWLLLRRQRMELSLRGMLPFVANTLCSNAVSLISIGLIARTDAVVYNPITSAIGTLCVMATSVLFKEKIGIRSCLAAGLAILAVII